MESKLILVRSAQKAARLAQASRNAVPKRIIVMQLGRDGKKRPCRAARSLEQVISDFWSKVDIRGDNECWPWKAGLKGRKPPYHYGSFWGNGRRWGAHQFALILTIGQLPEGQGALHHCDNPPCCNPAHLFVGTQADNNADCDAKGRRNMERGEDRYCAKLTEVIVRDIKRAAIGRKRGFIVATARRHGVSKAAIKNILAGLRWKHVTA